MEKLGKKYEAPRTETEKNKNDDVLVFLMSRCSAVAGVASSIEWVGRMGK